MLFNHPFKVIGTHILVIQIIGVFPQIDHQQWLGIICRERRGIVRLFNGQFFAARQQPDPARCKVRRALRQQFIIKRADRTECGIDSLGQITGRL